MPTETPDELISVRQAAKECGRNPETIRRWIWSGKLAADKLGNQLFVKRSVLEEYCREIAVGLHEDAKQDLQEIGAASESQSRPGVSSRSEISVPGAGQAHAEGNTESPPRPPGSRADIIKEMRRLREEIRSRVGNLDLEGTTEGLRRDRSNDLSSMH